ncbi:MAG: GTP-binding protein [Promethearchaeota archaeon]|nr:MAG: GTP-binding protein [Candidatus Lokiarchaeota archaeon]
MPKNSKQLEDIKIVIAGLDNAGKTSALIALRKKYDFHEEIKNLKPTIKIEYNSFNFLNQYTINLWDMGGQAKYRKIYVNNPIYFTETNFLYYLIDIQDEFKIEESVHYLHELLEIFREMGYKNEVVICFNKYDPKYMDNEEFKDRVEMIRNLVLRNNKDIIFKFYRTSIYDISSLSKAFSHSLNKLLNLRGINNELKRIVSTYNCNHAILYTNTGLIVSDHYNESMDSRDFDELIKDKINDDLEFFQRLTDNKVRIEERMSFINNNIEYVKKFDLNLENTKNSFYLGISVPFRNINEMKVELSKIYTELNSTFT